MPGHGNKKPGFLGNYHANKTREKIKVTQIVHRLQKFVDGEVELSQPQVRAAEILLKKALPDLQSISIEGVDDNPVKIAIEWANQSEES